jgi:acetolactate synthase I/II/III large subunit
MKLSDYVLQTLVASGARHVFFVPGGAAMHLNDSLGRTPGLAYTANLHEQAAAIAAEAWAKVTNDLAVCMTTAGPGATNAVTGLAGAWLDSSPVVFLSGQVKRADLKGKSGLRMLGVQEIDIVSVVSPLTKYAVTITEIDSIRFHLEKAIHLARQPRRGPVWIDLPLDVQASQVDPARMQGFDPASADFGRDDWELPAKVAEVVSLLGKAERPVVVAGNGIRLAGALEEFEKLIAGLEIPVLTTWLGIDLLAEDDKCFAGRPGSVAPRGANFTLQNCDLLLSIGARLDMAFTAYAHERLARGATKILVDVDPAEIEKMNMKVDVKIVADARMFLRELLHQLGANPRRAPAAWLERVRDWKHRYPVVLPEHHARTDYVSTYAFSQILSEELSEGEVVCPTASGSGIEIFLLCYEAKKGQRVFHNRGTGAMGFALPAAIGACLATERRRTICVDGDGGFQFNVQELETIRRYDLPIKVFVLNNQGYASIRTSQARYFQRLVGSDPSSGMTLPDTLVVAHAYGIPGMRISGGDDVRARVREALASKGPLVVDVMLPPEEPRQPSVVSAPRRDGSMVSKPLEDLWPFLDREEFRQNMIVPPIEE